jgi:hypothetical protein
MRYEYLVYDTRCLKLQTIYALSVSHSMHTEKKTILRHVLVHGD